MLREIARSKSRTYNANNKGNMKLEVQSARNKSHMSGTECVIKTTADTPRMQRVVHLSSVTLVMCQGACDKCEEFLGSTTVVPTNFTFMNTTFCCTTCDCKTSRVSYYITPTNAFESTK